jgi:hypothetical protein
MVTSRSGEAAIAQQRKHVDAIADPARLHQQGGAFAAERRAGDKPHALFLGGEHDVGDIRIVAAQRDQPAMARVRDITDLPNTDTLEVSVDRVRPRSAKREVKCVRIVQAKSRIAPRRSVEIGNYRI